MSVPQISNEVVREYSGKRFIVMTSYSADFAVRRLTSEEIVKLFSPVIRLLQLLRVIRTTVSSSFAFSQFSAQRPNPDLWRLMRRTHKAWSAPQCVGAFSTSQSHLEGAMSADFSANVAPRITEMMTADILQMFHSDYHLCCIHIYVDIYALFFYELLKYECHVDFVIYKVYWRVNFVQVEIYEGFKRLNIRDKNESIGLVRSIYTSLLSYIGNTKYPLFTNWCLLFILPI